MKVLLLIISIAFVICCQSNDAVTFNTTPPSGVDSTKAKELYERFTDSIIELEYESFETSISAVYEIDTFQIITMKAKVCNLICDEIHQAFLYNIKEKKTKTLPFRTVTHLYKLPEGYLLLDSAISHARDYSTASKRAYYFNVETDGFSWFKFEIPFDWGDDQSMTISTDKFSVEQQNVFDTPLVLSYVQEQNILKFDFKHDFMICCNEDSAFACSGYYILSASQFKLERYKAEKLVINRN